MRDGISLPVTLYTHWRIHGVTMGLGPQRSQFFYFDIGMSEARTAPLYEVGTPHKGNPGSATTILCITYIKPAVHSSIAVRRFLAQTVPIFITK